MRTDYDSQVFINCPFDEAYRPLFQAIVFAIHSCGMVARSALEVDNGAEVRIEKIVRIISECRHSIHDISRTELDAGSGLPRMNMPFELGLFLGAARFGEDCHKRKTCIIFDRERYRYQRFISDIAGQDIVGHGNQPAEIIRAIRNALGNWQPGSVMLPSGKLMSQRYRQFQYDLPRVCRVLALDHRDLGHRDLAVVLTAWLQANPVELGGLKQAA